ncbi:MAG: hypothetical protein QOH30_3466 [Baekduia sp.]|jgi:hypothetical protein|nr:hypothetical protein [Baekduia sp.]MDX6731353.1 hypothetical protein [Baekduia sp.]
MSRSSRLRWLLVAVVAAIVATTLLGRPSSGSSQAGPPADALTDARELLVEVDNAQQCHWDRHHRYGNVPELDETMETLAPHHLIGSLMGTASTAHLNLEIQLSASGKSYLQRITGRGVDTYVERRGADFADYGADGWHRLTASCMRPK